MKAQLTDLWEALNFNFARGCRFVSIRSCFIIQFSHHCYPWIERWCVYRPRDVYIATLRFALMFCYRMLWKSRMIRSRHEILRSTFIRRRSYRLDETLFLHAGDYAQNILEGKKLRRKYFSLALPICYQRPLNYIFFFVNSHTFHTRRAFLHDAS